MILHKVGEKEPLFRGASPCIVGSVKEGTRCFYPDEADIYVSLDRRLKDLCMYDTRNQALRVGGRECQKFLKPDGSLDAFKYFTSYLTLVYEAIGELDLSKGFTIRGQHRPFTMAPLVLGYPACVRCMSSDYVGRAQAKRCRHRVDCAPHMVGRPECDQCPDMCKSPDHQRTCSCEEYNTPCLTHSKIGGVLHMRWTNPDNSFSYISCDLSIPTFPTNLKYDGSLTEVQGYLRDNKPVGWLEEWSKLQDMKAAAASPHLISPESWQINPMTVLPSQV